MGGMSLPRKSGFSQTGGTAFPRKFHYLKSVGPDYEFWIINDNLKQKVKNCVSLVLIPERDNCYDHDHHDDGCDYDLSHDDTSFPKTLYQHRFFADWNSICRVFLVNHGAHSDCRGGHRDGDNDLPHLFSLLSLSMNRIYCGIICGVLEFCPGNVKRKILA